MRIHGSHINAHQRATTVEGTFNSQKDYIIPRVDVNWSLTSHIFSCPMCLWSKWDEDCALIKAVGCSLYWVAKLPKRRSILMPSIWGHCLGGPASCLVAVICSYWNTIYCGYRFAFPAYNVSTKLTTCRLLECLIHYWGSSMQASLLAKEVILQWMQCSYRFRPSEFRIHCLVMSPSPWSSQPNVTVALPL